MNGLQHGSKELADLFKASLGVTYKMIPALCMAKSPHNSLTSVVL